MKTIHQKLPTVRGSAPNTPDPSARFALRAPRASTVARVLLGLVFFVFGLNGFFHFLPQPPLPASAIPFVSGLASAGYFFPLLKSIEVASGILLLSNRFVPLALTVLAPIVVNIAAFHTFLAPSPAMVAFLLIAEIYLAWTYRAAFRGMLSSRPLHGATARQPEGAVAE